MSPLARSGGREQWVGMLGFFALFPGFFFYHTALGLGKIPAVLGGYFAPVSLLLLPLLLFCYAGKVRQDRDYLGKSDVAFFGYLAYFALIVGVNAVAGANIVIVNNHLLGIIFMLNVFIAFRMSELDARRFRLMALGSLLAMSAIVFAYAVDGAFYLAPLGTAMNPESLASYQGFSRSYLFTFAAAIAYTRTVRLRLLLYCLAASTLFVNTARSEFAALLFMIPIIELYYTRQKLLMTSIFLFLWLMLYSHLEQILSILPSNRILELLDLSHSTSANKRQHLTAYALNAIAQFPFFGDYASYSPGLYSHNVLSAWVDTGAFGFLFVLGILIVPAIPLFFKGYFARARSGDFILAFSLCCITVLLLATSHYFTDMLIGATMAAFSTYRYGMTHAHHRTSDIGPSAPRHPHLRQAMPGAGAAGT
ncbi:hypothetical protein HF313_13650 [Massilia atriviolacea]|uniref:O-antigen ligase domain-containing protein n=1 Tax=Massilia atriviolacea TaxID=2495579 RepID=A0A430HQI1_9BURK|nr:hypothetical protein [Massilia atriviolacea]RSZ59784.1 hypothetical protein EJB06_06185 [Massilia atriviolacea]